MPVITALIDMLTITKGYYCFLFYNNIFFYKDQTAILWEGDEIGESRKISYRELQNEVSKVIIIIIIIIILIMNDDDNNNNYDNNNNNDNSNNNNNNNNNDNNNNNR
jgi:hypothetical protein